VNLVQLGGIIRRFAIPSPLVIISIGQEISEEVEVHREVEFRPWEACFLVQGELRDSRESVTFDPPPAIPCITADKAARNDFAQYSENRSLQKKIFA